MTLQQLRYVTAVADTGTISRAAQQFFISQPSLTNAIRELAQKQALTLDDLAPYPRPQGVFASCEIGNKLTELEQWNKLKLVRKIAETVWGK